MLKMEGTEDALLSFNVPSSFPASSSLIYRIEILQLHSRTHLGSAYDNGNALTLHDDLDDLVS
jgi:hypothetical protein